MVNGLNEIRVFNITVLPRTITLLISFNLRESFLGQMLIRKSVIVKCLEFSFAVHRHHRVSFILHVLLASFRSCEATVTHEAQFANLHSFGQIGQEPLQVYKTLNVKDEKVVLMTHMI